jgi:glutaconate CoA-transferase, subunit A
VSGVPFAPVPGLFGSQLLAVRPDYKVIDNPFAPDERLVVVPAIRPDVALLHAVRAEPGGAAVVSAHGDAVMLAQASRRVIVSAEAIYDGATRQLAPDERLIADIYVDALVPAPGGAAPLGLRGCYEPDAAKLAAYVQAARSAESFAAFLREFVRERERDAATLR